MKTPELERFDHFLIARHADGQPIQLHRSPEETVFLAFDLHARRLTELHVLRGVSETSAAEKRSAYERATQASELRGSTFARILTVGEDDGLIFYSSSLSDGEFIEDYVARRGAIPAPTTFCLLLQLLEDLVQLQSYHRLISHLRLDRLMVTALEDTFLQLRIFDFGLAEKEKRTEDDLKRLSVEVCELIFLLLTGKPFSGENPDRFPVLTCLTSGLRSTLRSVLADNTQAPATLDRLRDDVKEAFAALVSNLQSRTTRKHLVVTNESLLPKSQLQDLLLENIPVDALMKDRFVVESGEGVRRYPFSIPARNLKNDQPVTVHLLPPSRVVPRDQYEAVPVQMWRFDPAKHPNILRSLSLWESPDWTFLTEERDGGFALSRLIAERITLNPSEVFALLKQARDGIEQALECGVQQVDLHPSNMVLQMAKAGPLANREFERLMQKRVDAWTPFRLKLRPHMTMRSLYEPLLSDSPVDAANFDEHFHAKDFRARAFISLAAYMLTGERLAGRGFEFPEGVPQSLADYISDCLEKNRHFGQTPQPNDFLAEFERRMGAPAAEGAYLSAVALRGPAVPVKEMESAGSISDFEGDTDAPPARSMPVLKPTKSTGRVPIHSYPGFAAKRKPSSAIRAAMIWSAVGVCVIALFFWLLSGPSGASAEKRHDSGAVASASDTSASGSAPDASQPSATKRALIMIRKAIVPSQTEIEELRRKQMLESESQQQQPAAPAQKELADRNANR